MNHLSYCLAAAQTWREKMKEARALTPSPSKQPTGHPGRPIAGLSWNEDTVLQDVKQAQDKPAREVCRAADFDLQGLWPFLYCLRLAKTLGPVADMRRGCSEVLEPKVWGLFPGAQGKIICSLSESWLPIPANTLSKPVLTQPQMAQTRLWDSRAFEIETQVGKTKILTELLRDTSINSLLGHRKPLPSQHSHPRATGEYGSSQDVAELGF